MNCPDCNRLTYYPESVGDIKMKPVGTPARALRAVNRDGTCYACRENQKRGGRGLPPRERQSRRVDRTEAARQEYEALCRWRRRRGVPEEGFSIAN